MLFFISPPSSQRASLKFEDAYSLLPVRWQEHTAHTCHYLIPSRMYYNNRLLIFYIPVYVTMESTTIPNGL